MICIKCGKELSLDHFPPTSSKFFTEHHANICYSCILSTINIEKLDQFDSFCQWLDIPFDPNLYMELLTNNTRARAIQLYCDTQWRKDYERVSWSSTQKLWRKILAEHKETDKENSAILHKQKMQDIYERWGNNYTEEELLFLDNSFNEMMRTMNIVTGVQMKDAKLLCIFELRINKALETNDPNTKDYVTMYINHKKSSKLDTVESRSGNELSTVGELMYYLEASGWKPHYHKNEPKDIVDFTISNLQQYTRDLVENESSIKEIAKMMEEQKENTKKTQAERFLDGETDSWEDDTDSMFYDFEDETTPFAAKEQLISSSTEEDDDISFGDLL